MISSLSDEELFNRRVDQFIDSYAEQNFHPFFTLDDREDYPVDSEHPEFSEQLLSFLATFQRDWLREKTESCFEMQVLRQKCLEILNLIQNAIHSSNCSQESICCFCDVSFFCDLAETYRPTNREAAQKLIQTFLNHSNLSLLLHDFELIAKDLSKDLTRKLDNIETLISSSGRLSLLTRQEHYVQRFDDLRSSLAVFECFFSIFPRDVVNLFLNTLDTEAVERLYVSLLKFSAQEQLKLERCLECIIVSCRLFLAKLLIERYSWESFGVSMTQACHSVTTAVEENSMPRFLQWALQLEEDLGDLLILLQTDMNTLNLTEFLDCFQRHPNTDVISLQYLRNLICGSRVVIHARPHVEEQANSTIMTEVERQGVRQVKDLLHQFGEGFIYMALKHWNFGVERTVNYLLEDNLPESLATLNRAMTLDEAENQLYETVVFAFEKRLATPDPPVSPRVLTIEADGRTAPYRGENESVSISAEEKSKILSFVDEGRIYEDEPDENYDEIQIPLPDSTLIDTSSEDDDEHSLSQKPVRQFGPDLVRGGRGRRPHIPVQGQTIAARRKETKKSKIGNHDRRNRHQAKLSRGML